jgi:hypothetical protein
MKALASAMLLEAVMLLVVDSIAIVVEESEDCVVGKWIGLEIKGECGICGISLSEYNRELHNFQPTLK